MAITRKAEDAEARWLAAYAAAGYVQPTDEEIVQRWREEPELYEDLCRVLGGYVHLWSISQERYLRRTHERRRRA